jgi:signal peptidase II
VTARYVPRSQRLRVYALAIACLAVDQFTKTFIRAQLAIGQHVVVTPFFSLMHVINRGGALSLLYGQRDLLALVGFVVALGVLIYEGRHPAMPRWQATALGILLGGTVGNMVDRLLFGQVTDFLDFHLGPYRWPTFNVADICINVGVAALIIGSALARPSTEEPQR